MLMQPSSGKKYHRCEKRCNFRSERARGLAWKMRHQRGRLVYKCLNRPWPPYGTRLLLFKLSAQIRNVVLAEAMCVLWVFPRVWRAHSPQNSLQKHCKKYSAFVNPRFWLEPIVRWQQDPRRVSGRGRFSYAFTDLTSRRTFFGGPFKPNSSNSKNERSTFSPIFPHFPPEIAKKRAANYDVKRVLRSRSDVKYGLRGLTGFRITHGGVEHKFDTPAEAMDYVKRHLMTP